MQINISGHHVEVTPPLEQFTRDKLTRLQRHYDKIISIDVILEIEKLEQKAKATIFVSGAKLHAHSAADDMYKAVDLLMDKLDRLVREHKEKMQH